MKWLLSFIVLVFLAVSAQAFQYEMEIKETEPLKNYLEYSVIQ